MPLTKLQEQQINAALLSGKKIEAIKIYREANSCGLKEAKEDLEAIEAQLRKTDGQQFEDVKVKRGCLGALVFCAILGALGAYAFP